MTKTVTGTVMRKPRTINQIETVLNEADGPLTCSEISAAWKLKGWRHMPTIHQLSNYLVKNHTKFTLVRYTKQGTGYKIARWTTTGK